MNPDVLLAGMAAMIWAAAAPSLGDEVPRVKSTVYVSKHFEVRDHDQPVKYVFNGNTRVARITGSLSTNRRIQRFRLHAGWNLLSLAVTADDLAGQVQRNLASPLTLYRWNQQSADYSIVTPGQTVPAETVFWVKATTNATVAVTGTYSDPVARQILGGRYVSGTGLEAWTPGFPSNATIWRYLPGLDHWQARLSADLAGISVGPQGLACPVIAPGQAIYIHADSPAELEIPPADLRIRYYHQDHLGSSSVMTDTQGTLVEETAFYPFGVPRNEHRLREVEEAYQFTQKERDDETGLDYFEARFLFAAGSRFITADPKFLHPDSLSKQDFQRFLSQPAKGNLYAYVLNNPLRYNDPTGLDKEDVDKISWGNDLGGLFFGMLGEFDTFDNSIPIKGAGAFSTGVSLGIKGTQFIMDPSGQTGAQFAWEVEKAAVSVAFPPLGLILAGLDLAGVGPSAWIEEMDQIIAEHKRQTKLFKEAAANWQKAARIYQEGAKKVGATLDDLRPKVEQLERATKQLIEAYKREDARIAAEIKKLEREIRQRKKEERYWKERERKALESSDR